VSAFGIHDPGGNGVAMTEVWAWVAVHSEGEQSITAVMVPGQGNTPLVFQQERVARQFLPLVQQLARQTGKPQRLVRLSNPETVTEVHP